VFGGDANHTAILPSENMARHHGNGMLLTAWHAEPVEAWLPLMPVFIQIDDWR
jgi:hypothetical protein